MRTAVVMFMALLLFCTLPANAQEDRMNFSGEWVMNADKSDMGGGQGGRSGRGGRGMMGGGRMVVKHQGDTLSVETFRMNRDGEEVSSLTVYILDGKAHDMETSFGTQVSAAGWDDDGKALTIESRRTMSRGGQEFTMDSLEKWSLKDGSLVIESVRTTPRGDMESTRVYDKE